MDVSTRVINITTVVQPLPPEREDVMVNAVVAILTSVLAILIIVGNGLIIVSVTVVKKLRQPANFLIVSLALSDFLVGLVVLPLTIVYDIAGEWVFGPMMCDVHVSLDVICCTASIMNLCMISIDRYLMITKPMTYPKQRTGRLMVFLIGLAWLISCLVIIPALFGFTKNVKEGDACLVSQEVWFTIYSTVCAFYIPLAIMLCMYWKIFMEASRFNARHKSRQMSYVESQDSPYNMPKISSHNASSSDNLSSALGVKDECTTSSIKSEGYVTDSSEKLLPNESQNRENISNNNEESVFSESIGNLKCEMLSSVQEETTEHLLQIPSTNGKHTMNGYLVARNNIKRTPVRSKSESYAQLPHKQTGKYANGRHISNTVSNGPYLTALNGVANHTDLKPVYSSRDVSVIRPICTRADAIKSNGTPDFKDAGNNKYERRTRHSIFSGSSACCSRPKFFRTTSAPARSNTIVANGDVFRQSNLMGRSQNNVGSGGESSSGNNRRRSTMFNQLKRRVSLATSRERLSNVKATRTLGIIVGAFTFCWLPFFIVTFLRPFVCINPESQDCIPLWLVRLVLWLGYVNSALNPLIYIGFSPDLRSTFQFLICCKCTNVDRRLAQTELRQAFYLERRASSVSRVHNSNEDIL